MNHTVTSERIILSKCRKMVKEKGLDSLNIRNVARACRVSVGSIYNYFPSKSDLVFATVNDIWKEIFHTIEDSLHCDSFPDSVEWVFRTILQGAKKYPEFFTLHSFSFAVKDKPEGKYLMEMYSRHLRKGMLETLQRDKRVRDNVFHEKFTQEEFVELIFAMIILLIFQEQEDCYLLKETVKSSIY